MSYDKKTGTINISSDDPKDFEQDLIAHFAHVTTQIEQDIAAGKLQPKKPFQHGIASSGPKQSRVPMKWIAVALNILLIVVVSTLVLSSSPSSEKDWLLALLFFATPIASLFALFLSTQESWLGLYLKRKALEEKKRIRELEQK